MLASPRLQQHLTFGSCSSTPGRLIGSVYIVGKLHTWPHRSTDRDTTLRLTGRCQLCLSGCPLFSATPMHVKKLWLLFLQIQCVNARRKSPPVAWRLFSSSARGKRRFWRGNLSWLHREMRVLRSQWEAAYEMEGESCEPRSRAVGAFNEARCPKVAVGSDF